MQAPYHLAQIVTLLQLEQPIALRLGLQGLHDSANFSLIQIQPGVGDAAWRCMLGDCDVAFHVSTGSCPDRTATLHRRPAAISSSRTFPGTRTAAFVNLPTTSTS